jgi:hypothetical protein
MTPQEAIEGKLYIRYGKTLHGHLSWWYPDAEQPDPENEVVLRDGDCGLARPTRTISRAEWDERVEEYGLWKSVGMWSFVPADEPAAGVIRYCHAHPEAAGRELYRLRSRGREDQESVAGWRNETFGRGPWGKVLGRLVEEMAELARHSGPTAAADLISEAADWLKNYGSDGDVPEGVGSELADAQIVLYGLADSCGVPLAEATDAKMVLNRSREWRVDGPGLGQHVDQPDQP